MQVSVGGTKILILDDEPPIADTLGVIFRVDGYEVRVAYSAEQAIEMIAAWCPDVALLDVMLPGMNGVDFAIVLKDNHPNCRILLFSGCESTQGLMEEAARQGHIFEILAKPTHPLEVLDRMRKLLAGDTGAGPDTTGGLDPAGGRSQETIH
jgi:DNA-binding response OmpR family regulator